MKLAHMVCSIVGAAALSFGLLAPQSQAQCPADVNADHSVTAQDLTMLLAAWGPTSMLVAADINQDQSVDAQDLAMLLAAWGSCPGPDWATVLEWIPDPAVVTDADFRARMIATELPWRVRANITNIEMFLVPPGTFTMGKSPGDTEAASDESPAHQVTLTHAFYLSRTEVTQATWTATMGTTPNYFDGLNHPVEQVSWNDCQSFCTATGFRLPTEAEWEYACRGGNPTPRYGPVNNIAWWGCNLGGNSVCTTHLVATKLPNALGLNDTLGNVWEWCQDWYGPYTAASMTDPTGPVSGTNRVLRGGSWDYNSNYSRASQRGSGPPAAFAACCGFRVARTATALPTITSVSPSCGPDTGATAITIMGTNFAGPASVTVGGATATNVVVVSATSITAVTPAGTFGAKNVVVTTPGGTTTAVGAFTYSPPLPWATVLEWTPDPAVVTDAAFLARITATCLPWRVLDIGTGMEMLLVPPGTFTMGASLGDAQAGPNESPAHQVTLTNAFYLSRTEVTQAVWQAEMGSNPSYFPGQPNNPVENISWYDCKLFCLATGMRLPTEAEWEYSCRGGNTTPQYGVVNNIAWSSSNSGSTTHLVATKLSNALGFYDTLGNVMEWCQDWYGPYTVSSVLDPAGPATGTDRLLRGGSWNFGSGDCRASERDVGPPAAFAACCGFRAAKTPYDAPTISSVSPNCGPDTGATAIMIMGTNFNGTVSVTVDGVMAASVVVVSTTSITAVTPAGAIGAQNVVVTTPGGSATAVGAFTYSPPLPWATVLEWTPDPAVVTDAAFLARITATCLPWRVLDNGTGIEMLLVPPGTFTMGASPGDAQAGSSESPAHQVTLTNSFYLGRTEVTQAQWQATMGSNPSGFSGLPNNPVENVSWNNCQSFCTATGMRLPTEAEWEYACRGGNTTPQYGVVNNIAWSFSNSGNTTHLVATKLPNALGFYDTLGNVWEWNQDWYGSYTVFSVLDPAGPASGTYRVFRGGSWGYLSSSCRASSRGYSGPVNFDINNGFRAARAP